MASEQQSPISLRPLNHEGAVHIVQELYKARQAGDSAKENELLKQLDESSLAALVRSMVVAEPVEDWLELLAFSRKETYCAYGFPGDRTYLFLLLSAKSARDAAAEMQRAKLNSKKKDMRQGFGFQHPRPAAFGSTTGRVPERTPLAVTNTTVSGDRQGLAGGPPRFVSKTPGRKGLAFGSKDVHF
ncbi:hypothetical protein N2152v2_004149 [Parachlorella kessleri]